MWIDFYCCWVAPLPLRGGNISHVCPWLKPPQTVWCIKVWEVSRGSVRWSAETTRLSPADPIGVELRGPLRPVTPQPLEAERQTPHPGRTTCKMVRLQGGPNPHKNEGRDGVRTVDETDGPDLLWVIDHRFRK